MAEKTSRSVFLWAAVLVFALAGCGATEVAQPAPDALPPSTLPSKTPVAYELAESPESEPLAPQWEWEFGGPEEFGLDPTLLERFGRAVAGAEIHSALIVRHGVIIHEYYADGFGENHLFLFSSCTKSVTGALIGIAIQLGYISGIDATLAEFLPEVAGTGKDGITIRDLLGHSSGIYWREWGQGTMFFELQRADNWLEFILSQPMEAAPGELFNYSSGGSYLLTVILQRATGRTALDFAGEHLFGPIGITSAQWAACPGGYSDGGAGLSMTARDAARFGLLYLTGGMWEGRQVVPGHWVEQSTSYQFPGAPGTGAYGYHWWLTTAHGHDLYYAMGAGGQYIFVVPKLELVVVMTGQTRDTYQPQWIFRDYLIPAFTW